MITFLAMLLYRLKAAWSLDKNPHLLIYFKRALTFTNLCHFHLRHKQVLCVLRKWQTWHAEVLS